MKTWLVVLVLALQSLWIIGTASRQEYGLRHGTTILLETKSVDPRDLLRGDYVILNYKISDLPRSLFQPPLTHELADGRTVYVALEKQGAYHSATRASLDPLEPRPGELVLEGRTEYGWRARDSGPVHVSYGLERYYVREGAGNPRGRLTVEAAVSPAGRPQIRQVFVEGVPYRDAMKDAGR